MESDYTNDPDNVAKFIIDRYGPLKIKLINESFPFIVDYTVIAHHIRDGVPKDYIDKGKNTKKELEKT